jgi:hypothetical protein
MAKQTKTKKKCCEKFEKKGTRCKNCPDASAKAGSGKKGKKKKKN